MQPGKRVTFSVNRVKNTGSNNGNLFVEMYYTVATVIFLLAVLHGCQARGVGLPSHRVIVSLRGRAKVMTRDDLEQVGSILLNSV